MPPKPAVQENLLDSLPDPGFGERDPDDPSNLVHFGTSTWAYPGWKGIVYSKKHKTTTDYLREYVRYPHFRTTGADFTFYRPPDPNLLASWLEFLPRDFKMVFKVWDEITVDRFQKSDQLHSPRRAAGTLNPSFLNAGLFEESFLTPFEMARFQGRVACFIFEFRSSTASSPERFLDRLESFLPELPGTYTYGVEIREPKLLGDRYFKILKANRVSHVYNHWDRMPPLSDQKARSDFTGPVVVSRILTPLKMPYAVAKRKFAPYNELRPENVLPRMRDDVVSLAVQAISQRLPSYLLVNNRSEGCAPLTIKALEEMLQNSLKMRE